MFIKFSKKSLKEIYITKKNLNKSLVYGIILGSFLILISIIVLYSELGNFYVMQELKNFTLLNCILLFAGNMLSGLGEEINIFLIGNL